MSELSKKITKIKNKMALLEHFAHSLIFVNHKDFLKYRIINKIIKVIITKLSFDDIYALGFFFENLNKKMFRADYTNLDDWMLGLQEDLQSAFSLAKTKGEKKKVENLTSLVNFNATDVICNYIDDSLYVDNEIIKEENEVTNPIKNEGA